MKRRTPPRDLTAGFREVGEAKAGRVCWLSQFDPTETRCAGRRPDLEAFHLVSQQRIRNILMPQLSGLYVTSELTADDVQTIVELAEWDSRNCGGLACTMHHRRFDNHSTPALRMDAAHLGPGAREFIDDWGFEIEAMRRFDNFDTAVLGAGVSASNPEPKGLLPSSPLGVGAEQGDRRAA